MKCPVCGEKMNLISESSHFMTSSNGENGYYCSDDFYRCGICGEEGEEYKLLDDLKIQKGKSLY